MLCYQDPEHQTALLYQHPTELITFILFLHFSLVDFPGTFPSSIIQLLFHLPYLPFPPVSPDPPLAHQSFIFLQYFHHLIDSLSSRANRETNAESDVVDEREADRRHEREEAAPAGHQHAYHQPPHAEPPASLSSVPGVQFQQQPPGEDHHQHRYGV